MAKKSSTRKSQQITWIKDINLPRDLIKSVLESGNRQNYDHIGSPPGPTKSLIKPPSSGPCIHNKKPLYPQLAEVTVHYISGWLRIERHTWALSDACCWYWYLIREENKDILKVTHQISRLGRPNWIEAQQRPWIKHENTTIDPYDSNNQVMKFTSVVACGGKFYALTMQGSLLVMEERYGAKLVITGMCKTRVVPSMSVKYFKDYLIESRGEVLLVFLIYLTSIERVDEVEVFKFDLGRLDLVKVDRLQGRTLLLEKKYSLWVDSGDIGCKNDCVYFYTGELGGNGDKWMMYDMKNCSISVQEPRITDSI